MDKLRETCKLNSMGDALHPQFPIYTLIVVCLVISVFVVSTATKGISMDAKKHIVLLGASVGKKWKIENLPQRIHNDKYTYEYVGVYSFDKTEQLQELLLRKEHIPDVIFIKECAAYFPGNLDHYKSLMQNWIEACQESDIIPIPATVVPVIRSSSLQTRAKDVIKSILGKPRSTARLSGLLAFNDWIRSYAAQNGLTVLDLEKALRISDSDRSLRLDLHSGDGLHLNENSYRLLDAIVVETVESSLKNTK